MLLAATACLHHGSVANILLVESEKAPVFRLVITSALYSLGSRQFLNVRGEGDELKMFF